jgi:hypothetical protein
MNDERYFQLVRYSDQKDDDRRFWLWMFSPTILDASQTVRLTALSIWRALHHLWEQNRQCNLETLHNELWKVYRAGAIDGGKHADVVEGGCTGEGCDDSELEIQETEADLSEIGVECHCCCDDTCELHLKKEQQIADREFVRGLFTECLNRDLAGLIAKMI